MSYQPPDDTSPWAQPGSGAPPPYEPPPSDFQPGYGPPPPPPRKSNLPIVVVILAVSLLLCGGVATAGVLIYRQATNKAKEIVEPITKPTLPTLPSNPVNIPDLPTEVPTLPDLPGWPESGKQVKVTYEVRGDGPIDIVYLAKIGEGPKTIKKAKLPWKFTTTTDSATVVSVTAVRGANDEGDISCRALVDGKEVVKKSETGAFASVTCTKALFGR
ncbi:MmpS family transport accessory protein [Actinoplanes sp. NPDC049265]|uniref:MmpS family transport accessory protein n=1 Tax=Actinoplanes sp. NPDC049265 TaxID=3363902 RepID=UPI0037153066